MMKFLRKYTRHMLAVFTALLLVVWLGGTALSEFLRPAPEQRVFAEAFGEELAYADQQRAGVETEILEWLGVAWSRPWLRDVRQVVFDRREPLDVVDWLLLAKEAERSGIVITPERLASFKKALGIGPVQMARVRDRFNIPFDQIDAILARQLRIQELGNLVAGGAKVSEGEIRRFVRDTQVRVAVRLIKFPADAYADLSAPVAEERVQEFFEKYRDDLPGEGEYGFGYRWPDRVRVEYIVCDIEAIAERIRVRESEAREYWEAHRTEFRRPEAEQPTTTQAEEGEPPPAPFYTTFEEAREQVIPVVRRIKAVQRAEELMRELQYALRTPWYGRERGPDGYVVEPPEVAKQPGYYVQVLQELAQREPRLVEALSVHQTDLVTADGAGVIPGLGSATATVEGRVVSFAEIAFGVQGLGNPPRDARATSRALYPSLYETAEPMLSDSEGNLYLFRVVEVSPSHEPASLDEVRSRVERDVRLYEGYQRAGEVARTILERAEGTTLEAAIEANLDLMMPVGGPGAIVETQPFARRLFTGEVPTVAGVQSEALVEACFRLAEQETGAYPRRDVVELSRERLWVLVELPEGGYQPVTREEYEALEPILARQLRARRMLDLQAAWWDPEEIRRRAGYRLAGEGTT